MSDLQYFQQRTSTRIPSGARIVNKKRAVLTINGMKVNVLPDTVGQVPGGAGAITKINFEWVTPGISGRGVVGELKINVKIQTVYKRGVNKNATTAYGRGTTARDKAGKNTSLRFHESQHGADYIQYMRDHQPPKFGGGKRTMTMDEFKAANAQFPKDMDTYIHKIDKHSKQNTDCVGHTIDQVNGTHICEP